MITCARASCIKTRVSSQADAIISNLQNIHTHEKEAEPTVLIAADTVCFPMLVSVVIISVLKYGEDGLLSHENIYKLRIQLQQPTLS